MYQRKDHNSSRTTVRRGESYTYGKENQTRPNTHCNSGYEMHVSGRWGCAPVKPTKRFRPDMNFDKYGFGTHPKQFKLNGKISRTINNIYWMTIPGTD